MVFIFLASVIRVSSINLLFSSTKISTNITFPLAKCSTFKRDGKSIRFTISSAVSCSGFTIIVNPKSSFIISVCLKYSGFLTLAIVLLAPSLLATRHAKILVSSLDVTATTKSASFVRASSCMSKLAPLPTIPKISNFSINSSMTFLSSSMAIIECPSFDTCLITVLPIVPQPITTIFIMKPLIYIRYS